MGVIAVSPLDPLTGDEEAGLILEVQSGNRQAFTSLVDRYWDRLYRWLCQLTRDGHAAEDLAQETFLKAFAAIARFRAGSNFRAWLFRIAHNNFVNAQRGTKFKRQPFPADWADDDDGGPLASLLSREALDTLADAVSRLPLDFRTALLLRAEGELSFREIADVLDITEETARWRVFKARQKLMTVLETKPAPTREPK